MRSAQSVSRAINSCSGRRTNSCPLPRQDARIVRTRPVEARSSVKIPLRESGLRPLSHPSSQELAGLPLPRRSHPGKNPCRTGESTTPRHLVFACGSRLPYGIQFLKRNRGIACGNVVEYAVCCGFRWKTRDRNLEPEMPKIKRARFVRARPIQSPFIRENLRSKKSS